MITDRLGEVRRRSGLSVRGFAAALREQAGYNVSHGSVSQYEMGTTVPAAYVEAVATAFGVASEWLLTGRGPAEPVEASAVERAFEQIAGIVAVARPGPPALEAQLDAFFRLSPDLFCILTPEGEFTRTNPAWTAVLGWDAASLLDTPIAELVHTDDAPLLTQLLGSVRDAASSGVPVVELRMRGASGAHRCISWNAAVAGGLLYAVGRDITDARRAARRLHAEHSVTRVLAESTEFNAAAAGVLRAAGESLGWRAGTLWLPGPGGVALAPYAFWGAGALAEGEFAQATRAMTFVRGQGVVGGVWASGEAAWVNDLAHDPAHQRKEAAAHDGLRAAYASPVHLGREALGVLEFYASQPGGPEPGLLQTMQTIGSQLGQFYKRTRSESALRGERDLSSLILDTVGVIVMLLDAEGRVLRLNSECERVLGYTTAELFGHEVISTLVPSEEGEMVAGMLQRLRDGNPCSGGRHHLLTREGERRLIAWNCRSLAGRDGHLSYIVRAGVLVEPEEG